MTKHDDFILRVDDFWKEIQAQKSYEQAVATLKEAYNALMK